MTDYAYYKALESDRAATESRRPIKYACVAQLEEQRPFKAWVEGSNPPAGTTSPSLTGKQTTRSSRARTQKIMLDILSVV